MPGTWSTWGIYPPRCLERPCSLWAWSAMTTTTAPMHRWRLPTPGTGPSTAANTTYPPDGRNFRTSKESGVLLSAPDLYLSQTNFWLFTQGCTVTVQMASYFPSSVIALIIADPSFRGAITAVLTAFLCTETIPVLLDFQVILFSVAVSGLT